MPQSVSIPFHLLSKPTGAICNLGCKYCFFLSKEALYPGSKFQMDEPTLERYLQQLFDSSAAPEVNVAWQGGEPTLMGIDFFRRSVNLAKKFKKPRQSILHTIQTNGTQLNDEWCGFFKDNNYLVGLSVDGPKSMHDAYRVTKGGKGTFDDVIRGWELLRKHNVDVNILCTIHAVNQDHGLEVYRFFRDVLKAEHIQLIPIVERATEETMSVANQGWEIHPGAKKTLYTQSGSLVTERTVDSQKFGRFLIEIFDEWVKTDVGKVYVQTFDVALGSWLGQHNMCIVAPTCGSALALEHNGDVFSCDHFVEPEYLLGNILDRPLGEMVSSPKQRKFGNDKYTSLPKYCKECPVLFACYGECPRNRFIQTPDGEGGLNYLCAGYKAFYAHIDPTLKVMAALLRKERFADEFMQMSAEEKKAVLSSSKGPKSI
jgi:uncharacterized protein